MSSLMDITFQNEIGFFNFTMSYGPVTHTRRTAHALSEKN